MTKVETVSIQHPDSNKITIQDVNTQADERHRKRAKEVGILYVDYLHLFNNNKLEVIESQPSHTHAIPN